MRWPALAVGCGLALMLASVGIPRQMLDRSSPSRGSSAETAVVASLPIAAFTDVPSNLEAFERAAPQSDAEEGDARSHAVMQSWVSLADALGEPARAFDGPVQVSYTMDVELTRQIFKVLHRGRVSRGHVIVMDPESGRVLAYASTDVDSFPATNSYPAASLVKLVTAAAALHYAPDSARGLCRYRGNPYRLTPSRVYPPKYGNEMSLERALATSNNQCFAQLAVNAVGGEALLGAMTSFGLTDEVASGHDSGVATAGDSDYDLGRLGCGLAGCRITPLHAVQLAATLANGERVHPWWIDGVRDAEGREIALERDLERRQVMTPELAAELRQMLVRTTTRGTARSAFRDRRGRPRLRGIEVAGKTGNLSGNEPQGRYEWFIGLAPADKPTVAIAVVQVQGHLWWSKSSQIAADVLYEIFCDRGECEPRLASRFTDVLGDRAAPIFLSESGRPLDPH